MAATRKTTTKKDDENVPAEQAPPAARETDGADEVLARGGWDVGYVGDRVDQTPNEAYTVTGVLKSTD